MATRDRGRATRLVAPLAVLVLAAGAGAARWAGSPAGDEPDLPLAVSATSTYQFDDLAAMVRASDLVVRARVEATSRGRLIGDGEAAVVSRIVTLRVEDVLAGTPGAGTVLVEEEGWLADGTPIAVSGLAPSEEGMDAIWFLDERPDPELPGYLVINHQGRYVVDGDELHGALGDDPLVDELEDLSRDQLALAVRATTAAR